MSEHTLPPGAAEWLRNGERGTSSETIFGHLTGIPIAHPYTSTPADPDDLRRCRLLLEAVPAFRDRLHEMASAGHGWPALVEHWDELCELMDRETPGWRDCRGRAPQTFAMMRALEALP